jgi:hypothetical protein
MIDDLHGYHVELQARQDQEMVMMAAQRHS